MGGDSNTGAAALTALQHASSEAAAAADCDQAPADGTVAAAPMPPAAANAGISAASARLAISRRSPSALGVPTAPATSPAVGDKHNAEADPLAWLLPAEAPESRQAGAAGTAVAPSVAPAQVQQEGHRSADRSIRPDANAAGAGTPAPHQQDQQQQQPLPLSPKQQPQQQQAVLPELRPPALQLKPAASDAADRGLTLNFECPITHRAKIFCTHSDSLDAAAATDRPRLHFERLCLKCS